MRRWLAALACTCTVACHDDGVLVPYRFVGGRHADGAHSGVDFAGAYREPILAADDGVVFDVATSDVAGLCVSVEHRCGDFAPSRFFTSYCHLASSLVRRGTRVVRGEPIARMGRSGTGAHAQVHLHFSLCTFACRFGTSDGALEGTLDPLSRDAGCFQPDLADQPANGRLTRPVVCSGR